MTTTQPSKPTWLAKLREVRRIADAARWGLLDVIIWLNEIEEEQLAQNQTSSTAGRSGVLGEEDHYADHEDYVPQGDIPSGDELLW